MEHKGQSPGGIAQLRTPGQHLQEHDIDPIAGGTVGYAQFNNLVVIKQKSISQRILSSHSIVGVLKSE